MPVIGMDKVLRDFKKAQKTIERQAEFEAYNFLTAVKLETIPRTPIRAVNGGNLRSSFAIEKVGDDFYLYNSANYALVQHEKNKSKGFIGKKFLERGFDEAMIKVGYR